MSIYYRDDIFNYTETRHLRVRVGGGPGHGPHWLTATDHSSDLDETGDGSYSYATPQWEYTVFD